MFAGVDEAIVGLLEAAVARNLLDYVTATERIAPEVGAAAISCGLGVAAFMGADSPLTTVKGIGSDPDDDLIDACEAFFRSHGAPRATLELTPWSSPETHERLAGRGYRIVDQEDVVVRRPPYSAAEPAHPVQLVPADTWPQLQIDVNEPSGAPEWRILVDVCAALPGVRLGIRNPVDGWVACAQLVPAPGVGILANDATRASARGKGAQAALIRARLLLAAPTGLACVMAEVAPGSTSERNYLRSGFEVAYTRVHYRRALLD